MHHSTGSGTPTGHGSKSAQREKGGDTPGSAKEKHHLLPPTSDVTDHFSKGKKIFSRVNKLFKSPRKHHRKLSESRSDEGAASTDTDDYERSSEIPLGNLSRVQPSGGPSPRHFSPEPARRRMTTAAGHHQHGPTTYPPPPPPPSSQQHEETSSGHGAPASPLLVSVESEPVFVVKPLPIAAGGSSAAQLPGTPQHQARSIAEASGAASSAGDLAAGLGGAGADGAARWDETQVDVEATHDLLGALRDKMSALHEDIQAEMGHGATTLKDFLATLDNSDVTEKSRQSARKTFERGNRSRSKRLLQLQAKLEQLMQVTQEVHKTGVPRGREPEEYVKTLGRSLPGSSGKRKGVLGTVKQVGHRLEGAVDNMKGAAGSLGRSLKKPVRSNSMDNLLSQTGKDNHSDDGELSSYAGGSSTLPRVSGGPHSVSDHSEHQTNAGASASGAAANLSVVGSRQSGGGGGGPGTAKTASSSGGGAGGGGMSSSGAANGLGATTTGGADTSSSRERRSTSECSQSNTSLREEVSALRSLVDDVRQQMENNNYAVEVNRRDLVRNADFYRMGLEETNSKMERLEELFNESINTLKEEIHALGEQLEYRFIDRHRNLRDNVESLRNQQSQIERRYEQQFRTLGSLDTGELYAPSLLKTRLLDLLIAVFNLLVFLLSAVVQLGIRLANLGSHIRRHPGAGLALLGAFLLIVAIVLALRETAVGANLEAALLWLTSWRRRPS